MYILVLRYRIQWWDNMLSFIKYKSSMDVELICGKERKWYEMLKKNINMVLEYV